MMKSCAISLLLLFINPGTSTAKKQEAPIWLVTDELSYVTSNAQQSTCNRNGGSAMSFDGACNSRNYTWTEQCNVEERDGWCHTTAKSCGCQVIYPEGHSSGIGSGSKGCANACVTVTDNVPQDRTCQASGSAMSFVGSCDSRDYIYTSSCSFDEQLDPQTHEPVQCTITANSCGCLYWEEDSAYIGGLDAGSKNCDACAARGYPPKPSSAPGFSLGVNVYAAAFISTAWLFM